MRDNVLIIVTVMCCVLQANHRKFVEHVVQGSVKKVEKMLETGSDPNFITEDGSKSHSYCGR